MSQKRVFTIFYVLSWFFRALRITKTTKFRPNRHKQRFPSDFNFQKFKLNLDFHLNQEKNLKIIYFYF